MTNSRPTEFAKFLLVGGFSAGVNIVSRYLINFLTSFSVAIVAAYIVGMITAFFLNRAFVFTKSLGGGKQRQFIRFTIVNIVAVAQVWLVSYILAKYALPWLDVTFHPKDIAHVIGVIVPVFTSYFGHKHFSFRAEVNLKSPH